MGVVRVKVKAKGGGWCESHNYSLGVPKILAPSHLHL